MMLGAQTTSTTQTCFARVPSPVGELLVIGERREPRGRALALRGIYFANAAHAKGAIPEGAENDASVFAELVAQLEDYFAGRRTTFDLELAPRGTEFQRKVWRALATIPYGETTTYSALAHAIGKPDAVRAVGAANGKNPISIVVPCHRVIGHDGSLTGYAGGIANKRRLLAIESRRLG